MGEHRQKKDAEINEFTFVMDQSKSSTDTKCKELIKAFEKKKKKVIANAGVRRLPPAAAPRAPVRRHRQEPVFLSAVFAVRDADVRPLSWETGRHCSCQASL